MVGEYVISHDGRLVYMVSNMEFREVLRGTTEPPSLQGSVD